MKTNKEIRQEAWGIVRGKWFWRIVAASSILYIITMSVSLAILASFSDMGIQTWTDFLQAKIKAFQSGLGYTVPSWSVFWQMTGATAFQQFLAYVFGAILLFGMAGVMLKAVRNDENGWFGGAFGGFKRPLELAWLLMLMNFLVFLWGLLFIIPGLIAIYRYRQAWYLKSENPDWSAWKCLRESGVMMKGKKWKAFCLDLSFLGWFFLAWLVLCSLLGGASLAARGALIGSFVTALTLVIGFYVLAFVLAYFAAARAVFYKEITISDKIVSEML